MVLITTIIAEHCNVTNIGICIPTMSKLKMPVYQRPTETSLFKINN